MAELIFKVSKVCDKKNKFLSKKTKNSVNFTYKKFPFKVIKNENIVASKLNEVPFFEQISSPYSTATNYQSTETSTKKGDDNYEPKFYSSEEIDKVFDIDRNLSEKNLELQFRRKSYLEVLNEIDPKKRRILLDWIMEISSFYQFKRETYHLSVVLLDLYLSTIKSLSIKNFQLVGVTCLLIAAKNEEILIPCVQNFAQSTQYAYISKQILECEVAILNGLRWKIQFLTLSFWGNYVISKWDDFSKRNKSLPLIRKNKKLYFDFFSVIDTISLDYFHIYKDMKIIAVSVLYLIIGMKMNFFTLSDIKKFEKKESYTDNYLSYNLFIDQFFVEYLGIELNQCNEHIGYVSMFFQKELFDKNKEIMFENIDVNNQDYSVVKKEIMERIEKAIYTCKDK